MILIRLLLMGMLPMLLTINLYAQHFLSPEQKQQYALKLLKQYDSEGLYIIQQVNQLAKENHFDRYAEEHTYQGVRDAVGTMVHELNHVFSAMMAWKLLPRDKNMHSCYYIADSTYILVKHSPVFKTEEIGKSIRPQLRSFRFETYVYDPDEPVKITSNTLGIYGLMDEWAAYYHGTRIDVNMYKWYQENTKGTIKDWYSYFSNVGSVINAYVEFKFYCLAYLLYAQKNYPDIYQGILQNQSFVEVFLLIDRLFGDLVKEYWSVKKVILNGLKAKGVKVSEDDEWIMMNEHGVGNFVKEYNLLKKEIDTPAYQTMLRNLELCVQPNQADSK